MTITWDENATPHPVASVEEFDAHLDRLHANAAADGRPLAVIVDAGLKPRTDASQCGTVRPATD